MSTVNNFKDALRFKFERICVSHNRYRRDNPIAVVLEMEEKDSNLILTFTGHEKSQSISIPVPYQDVHDNTIIGNRVCRAVGSFHIDGKEHDYWTLMLWLLTGRIEHLFPQVAKRSQLERLVLSMEDKNTAIAFRSFQEIANNIINKMPLTGTPYETWAMCNRVVFFKELPIEAMPPDEAMKYQMQQNIDHFPWTSLGLSDSAMVKDYLLKVDLRKYTPFGLKNHNPMRNIYQTLGMRGDEEPQTITESAKQIGKSGVVRTGWNWMTCFLDTPLNFEDQLVVDSRHMEKFTVEERRIVCFGEPVVQAGDELSYGDVLSNEPNGKPMRFFVKADRGLITDISLETVVWNGSPTEVSVLTVETKHAFKEGIKLTNCHGNKGVVTFADCGTMYDEVRQQEVPIDIMVAAQTVGKRKNYGQVLEALLTLVSGKDKQLVLKDDAGLDEDSLARMLKQRGYNPDGTSPVKTQWGNTRAVCGWSFWGLIKNPENQLWIKDEVLAVDNLDRRDSGLKISHIELKSLTTIFGAKNAVVSEILEHQQGVDDVHDLVNVLECLRGKSFDLPVVSWENLRPIFQSSGYFHSKDELRDTMSDDALLVDGFMLQLPGIFHVYTPDDKRAAIGEMFYEGSLTVEELQAKIISGGSNVFIDKLYIPSARLRSPWQHNTGLWGISDLSGYLNNLLQACHKQGRAELDGAQMLAAISRYFRHVSERLSTKSGEIATYALSVRYPHSVKATATLAKEGLPENWLEIHSSMAEDLGVQEGDYVIAERFPCLGFKSLRIQRVQITDDPQCEYVIRVSGNSLVSQNLDFDGDVLFLMSFKTAAARAELEREFLTPDPLRDKYIRDANDRKQPRFKALTVKDFAIKKFGPLTPEWQAEIVADLTGVKRGTGSTVALAYNLMRIIEGKVGYEEREVNLGLEVILDTVANSVFSQKHAGESLEKKCKEAICRADLSMMLSMGFPEEGSRQLCRIIKEEAKSLGVRDLNKHYERHLTAARSNIINTIVREKHKIYFATRSNLNPVRLLEHLDSVPTDLVGHLWHRGKKQAIENHGN